MDLAGEGAQRKQGIPKCSFSQLLPRWLPRRAVWLVCRQVLRTCTPTAFCESEGAAFECKKMAPAISAMVALQKGFLGVRVLNMANRGRVFDGAVKGGCDGRAVGNGHSVFPVGRPTKNRPPLPPPNPLPPLLFRIPAPEHKSSCLAGPSVPVCRAVPRQLCWKAGEGASPASGPEVHTPHVLHIFSRPKGASGTTEEDFVLLSLRFAGHSAFLKRLHTGGGGSPLPHSPSAVSGHSVAAQRPMHLQTSSNGPTLKPAVSPDVGRAAWLQEHKEH